MPASILADLIRANRMLDVWCGACHRPQVSFLPTEACVALGEHLTFAQAARRLKCRECGATGKDRPGVSCRPGWLVGYDPQTHGPEHVYERRLKGQPDTW